MVTVKVKGVEATLKSIRSLPQKLEKKLDSVIGVNVREMERNAKRDAPKDQGLLVNEITTKRVAPLRWTLVSQALYSAYIEFGTKTKVRIPAGLQDEAAKAKAQVNATTLGVKEAIFNWCERSGIEQRLWYPIFLSIMIKGIKPHPFFFKQGDRQAPIIEKDIQQAVNEERL